MNNDSAELSYLQMSGSEFQDCVMHTPGAKLLLKSPKLKYYFPWWDLLEKPSREVFLAVVKTVDKEYSVVGMIELQAPSYNKTEILLAFISVDPTFQRQGVATRLLGLMTEYLASSGKILKRSRSGNSTPVEFQSFVDHMLNSKKLPWKQGERFANLY